VSITIDRLKSLFSTYIGSRTVDEMAHTQGDFPQREIESICCATNLHGFDALCLHGDAQQIARVLNGYYARISEGVLESNGDLNNFAGGMTVSLYRPGPTISDQRTLATTIVSVLDKAATTLEHSHGVRVGVGLCAGPLVYGRFGSRDRATVTGFGPLRVCATRLAHRSSGINLCERLAELCNWAGASTSISVHAHAVDPEE
jgi:class 3 adenylate cyclase